MPNFPIGDMSQFFQNANQTAQIKSRMQTLTQEMATGKVADIATALGGDTRRLTSIDREISLLDSFTTAGADLDRMFTQQGLMLDGMNGTRVRLAEQFLAVTTGSTPTAIAESGVAGRAGFIQVVGALNGTIGGRSLFAGTTDNTSALAAAEDMLADIMTTIGGATDSTTIAAVLDDWFDDPAGGFATMGYLGDTGGTSQRKISAEESVPIAARADDATIRATLKGLALAAVVDAGSGTLPDDTGRELIALAGSALNAASVGLVSLTASVGAAQSRLEEVNVRQSAQRAAFAIARNDLTAADPYETAIKLQDVQTQLELQFTMTSRLQSLSLVNYL